MPVSRRISEQAKQLQLEAEEELKRQQGSSTAAHKKDDDGDVQHLSFDGLEVSAETSLAGISSARTRRRREAAKATKEERRRKKRKRSPTPSAEPPAAPASAELTALHRLSHPPTPSELHLVHNKRERRAIQRRVERDEALVASAIAHHVIEPAPSAQGIAVDRTAGAETWKLSQDVLAAAVDVRSAERRFELELNRGPYAVDYTRNGKHVLIGGRKGHVAVMEWKSHKLLCEMNVSDEVRDVHFLHNHQMFAVAQRRGVHLYDSTGLELHSLPQHADPLALDFLPYHFLLTSIGEGGWLKYHDTSTGVLVAQHRTKLGPCRVMTHNPRNAVTLLGHDNGVVTMWSPTMKEPLVRMLTHKAAVTAVAVSADGAYLVTAGLEGQWKVWDCRTYKELHAYFAVRPVCALDVSQTGMVGLAYGSHVAVWKDALTSKARGPYLTHNLPGQQTSSLAFCPFEDTLAVGHSHGFSSLLTPASSLLAYDSLSADPFESKRATRERIVHSLLEKLQPDMISLQPSVIGMMDADSQQIWEGERRDLRQRRTEEQRKRSDSKDKQRGKQKSSKRYRRKRSNVVDSRVVQRREDKDKQTQEQQHKERQEKQEGAALPSALQRFVRKR